GAQHGATEVLDVNRLVVPEFDVLAIDQAFPSEFEADKPVSCPDAGNNRGGDNGVHAGTIPATIDNPDCFTVELGRHWPPPFWAFEIRTSLPPIINGAAHAPFHNAIHDKERVLMVPFY